MDKIQVDIEKPTGDILSQWADGELDSVGSPASLLDDMVSATPIEKVTDIEWLQYTVVYLYQLLDDIDTMDDAAKDKDLYYRNCVREIQKKKTDTGITTDGYNIFKR